MRAMQGGRTLPHRIAAAVFKPMISMGGESRHLPEQNARRNVGRPFYVTLVQNRASHLRNPLTVSPLAQRERAYGKPALRCERFTLRHRRLSFLAAT